MVAIDIRLGVLVPALFKALGMIIVQLVSGLIAAITFLFIPGCRSYVPALFKALGAKVKELAAGIVATPVLLLISAAWSIFWLMNKKRRAVVA